MGPGGAGPSWSHKLQKRCTVRPRVFDKTVMMSGPGPAVSAVRAPGYRRSEFQNFQQNLLF
eukprot:596352-Hanusia_phi.AAC.1